MKEKIKCLMAYSHLYMQNTTITHAKDDKKRLQRSPDKPLNDSSVASIWNCLHSVS